MSVIESVPDEPMVPAVSDAGRAVSRGRQGQLIREGRSTRINATGIYATEGIKDEIVDEVRALYARVPHLDPVVHGPVVESLGRMLVRLRRLDAALDGPDATRDMLALVSRLEGQVRLTAESLGMTPRSQAALGLARLDGASKQRRLQEEQERKYAPVRKRKKP